MFDNMKKKVSYALTYFGLVLLYPLYQKSFNEEWDEALNKILDAIEAKRVQATLDEFTLRVDDYRIWIANRWFAYGHLYGCYNHLGFYETPKQQHRPKFATMIRLNEIVKCLEAQKPKENIYPTIKKSFSTISDNTK